MAPLYNNELDLHLFSWGKNKKRKRRKKRARRIAFSAMVAGGTLALIKIIKWRKSGD